MDAFYQLILRTVDQVALTFSHNWPFLVVSVLIAVALKLYVNPQRVSAFLMRYKRAGVVSATVAAVATPLCSCGTTAIVLGMMASMMPWAPIVAFMVASPLTSPEELIYSAGLFGWPFALAFFAASIILGLLGGVAAIVFENRGWLKNQARFAATTTANMPAHAERTCSCGSLPAPVTKNELSVRQAQTAQAACGCSASIEVIREPSPALAACGCSTPADLALEPLPATLSNVCPPAKVVQTSVSAATPAREQVMLRRFAVEALDTGKRLLLMFLGFAFIGYFLNGLIPPEWVSAIFGQGAAYSVPLAATLGLPLYVNTEASLPLVRALLDGGMSQGAALAFLISGAGTSVGAVAGALTIARWRVIALVIGTLWVGAVVCGFLYNFLLAAGV
jgi:uncharacterized membrane protein YraQ (UPF0718 family)